VYLALAPKSNAVYTAYAAVQADIQTPPPTPSPALTKRPHQTHEVPRLRKDYQYAHDVEGK